MLSVSAIFPTNKPIEPHLGQPNNFDGTPTKAMVWLYSVQVYLMVNNGVYNMGEKKFTFTLSFMKGSAQTWATTFIRDSLNSEEKSFGEFIDFAKKFEDSPTPTSKEKPSLGSLTPLS